MPLKENNSHLVTAGVIYSYLKLDETQLRQAADFIQKEQFHIRKAHLTFWEKLDYEYDTFRNFLDEGQMRKYLRYRNRRLKDHQNSLIENDSSEMLLKDIERSTNEIKYLQSVFLPRLKRESSIIHWFTSKYGGNKLNFLKSEYQTFLNEKYHGIISDHFREYRHYKPNELKSELLKHRIGALYPAFSKFRFGMDEVIISAVNFISVNLKMLSSQKSKLEPVTNDLYAFRKKASDEHFDYLKNSGLPYVSTTIKDARSDDEREQDYWFSLLLIDEDCYGYTSC